VTEFVTSGFPWSPFIVMPLPSLRCSMVSDWCQSWCPCFRGYMVSFVTRFLCLRYSLVTEWRYNLALNWDWVFTERTEPCFGVWEPLSLRPQPEFRSLRQSGWVCYWRWSLVCEWRHNLCCIGYDIIVREHFFQGDDWECGLACAYWRYVVTSFGGSSAGLHVPYVHKCCA